MSIKLSKIALTATLALAITFTLSCSSDDGGTPPPSGESSSSSTNGGTSGEDISSSSTYIANICGDTEYDANTYRCENGELIGKCKGADFYPAYQVCNDGVIEDKNPLSSSSFGSSIQSSSSLSSSSRFCKSNDLGKGYDVIGSPYINWPEVNPIAVLDQDKMCQDGILELDKPGSAQQYASFYGSTITELYSQRNESMKIGANLGVDISIPIVFSARFEVKFATKTSSSSQQNQSLKYYYSQIRSYLYTGEDQIKSGSATAQNLSKYLTSGFISDLKSAKPPGQILDLYGSHIFIHYYKGGSLEANYTYLGSESSSRFTSASQMEAAAKASFKKIDGGINVGTSNSNEQAIRELEENMSFNYETYGGDPLKATDMAQLVSKYGSWVSSIASNARTTGIKDFAQSFIPVWDLAGQVEGVTTARINALKDEFKRRAEAQGARFPVEEISCTPEDNNSTHYCSNGGLREYGSVTDDGGNTYKTVVIGTQTWMAENLNYNVTGSKCYDDLTSNCSVYGRLYDWATAMKLPSNCNSTSCLSQISAKHKGICPAGYHIPTDANWDALVTAIGGSSTADRYLKATVGWKSCGNSSSYSYKCEDKYGFSALPGGSSSVSNFNYAGSIGDWWSASESSTNNAYDRYMRSDIETANLDNSLKTWLLSVRCLKD